MVKVKDRLSKEAVIEEIVVQDPSVKTIKTFDQEGSLLIKNASGRKGGEKRTKKRSSKQK